jgi:ATP-dependent DNA ligase
MVTNLHRCQLLAQSGHAENTPSLNTMYEAACELGLEGIVSSRLTARDGGV